MVVSLIWTTIMMPVGDGQLVLVFCDYFQPNGNPVWKLRYPWVGGSGSWLFQGGIFAMDFAFRGIYVVESLGAYLL